MRFSFFGLVRNQIFNQARRGYLVADSFSSKDGLLNYHGLPGYSYARNKNLVFHPTSPESVAKIRPLFDKQKFYEHGLEFVGEGLLTLDELSKCDSDTASAYLDYLSGLPPKTTSLEKRYTLAEFKTLDKAAKAQLLKTKDEAHYTASFGWGTE